MKVDVKLVDTREVRDVEVDLRGEFLNHAIEVVQSEQFSVRLNRRCA